MKQLKISKEYILKEANFFVTIYKKCYKPYFEIYIYFIGFIETKVMN